MLTNITFSVDHLSAIDTLETFNQRCSYMQTLINDNYPFYLEEQPEAWVQRLIVAQASIPIIVVDYIDRTFGRNMICMEASEINGYPTHIIDTLGMFLETIQDNNILDRNTIEDVIIRTIILLRYRF